MVFFTMIDEAILLSHPDGHDQAVAEALVRLDLPALRIVRVADEAALLDSIDNAGPFSALVIPAEHPRAMDFIRTARGRNAVLVVLVTAAEADVALADEVMAAGANDLVVAADRLAGRLRIFLRKLAPLRQALEDRARISRERDILLDALGQRHAIAGSSPAIRDVLEQIERVAAVPRPVLITGERGTGKELVARAIHTASKRTGPMVSVNCAAFADDLLESELFGHERGAYTGAHERTVGRFEQADGGTLFLDEIGNMSSAFQRKILRVVEYGVFSRVGGQGEIATSARIVSATNVDLRTKISEGAFLSDLYDRLAFDEIRVPPLRERGGDVEYLAQLFLDQFVRDVPSSKGRRLSPGARRALYEHRFPGNVRELKHAIERAAYRASSTWIQADDLGLTPSSGMPADESATFEEQVQAFEASLLRRALEAADGVQARAARALGLTYDQFRYHAKKHGLLGKRRRTDGAPRG